MLIKMWYAKFPVLELCICLLGYCAAYGSLKPTFLDYLSVLSLRVSPETSVSNHLTPHNNPEDGRIQFNRGASLRSRNSAFIQRVQLRVSCDFCNFCDWGVRLQSQCTSCTALTVVCCTWNIFWTLRRFVFQEWHKKESRHHTVLPCAF
jgi:hypothetical protein